MTLYLGLLLAYSAALIGMGLWLGRKVESASAFFIFGNGGLDKVDTAFSIELF